MTLDGFNLIIRAILLSTIPLTVLPYITGSPLFNESSLVKMNFKKTKSHRITSKFCFIIPISYSRL